MARHGEELHLIRPDRVYGTGVLTAIPGFNPVANAQDVAARFTAIWAPNVRDAPPPGSGAGVSAQATSPVPTPAAPNAGMNGLHGFGKPAGPIRRWWNRRKLRKALEGYRSRQISGCFGCGMRGLGDVRPPSPGPGSIPIVGGYQPQFQTMQEMGLSLTAMTPGGFPPVFMPAMAAAAGITPYALSMHTRAQQQVGHSGLPPVVSARAVAASDAYADKFNNYFPWWPSR